jgi:hypothetical protein
MTGDPLPPVWFVYPNRGHSLRLEKGKMVASQHRLGGVSIYRKTFPKYTTYVNVFIETYNSHVYLIKSLP